MKTLLVAIIILSGVITVVIILSIIIYPVWLTRDKSDLFWGAGVSTLATMAALFTYLKNFTEVFKKKDKSLESDTAESIPLIVSHGSRFNGLNITADTVYAENIIGTKIDFSTPIPSDEVDAKKISDSFISIPLNLPEYFIERYSLISDLRSKLGMLPAPVGISGTIMVGLFGLGGVGKTMLAQSILRQDDFHVYFSDGFLWASIGPDYYETNVISNTIVSWMNSLRVKALDHIDQRSKISTIRRIIGEKKILFVLDDVWEANSIEDLLQCVGINCSVIITTRNREVLAKLGINNYITLDRLSEDEAYRLVSKRLSSKPTHYDWGKIKTFCNRIDWHPLSLSLASTQVSIGDISWDEILDSIEKHELYKIIDYSDPAQRNESVKFSLDMSISRLSDADKKRLIWLGVLAEGYPFYIEEAASIFPDTPKTEDEINTEITEPKLLLGETRESVIQTLKNLHRRGLLNISGYDIQTPIYSMHPVVHEYCRECLQSNGELNEAITRHAIAYFMVLTHVALDFEPKFKIFVTREQWNTVLNRAWKSLQSNGKIVIEKVIAKTIIMAFSNYLSDFWLNNGQFDELILWNSRSLEIAREQEDISCQIDNLSQLGLAYQHKNQIDQAISHVKSALDFIDIGDPAYGQKKYLLGGIYLAANMIGEAINIFLEVLEIARNNKDRELEGKALGNLGNAYMSQGNSLDDAIKYLEDGLEIANEIGDQKGASKRIGNLGQAYFMKGDYYYHKALNNLLLSTITSRKMDDFESYGIQLARLGDLYLRVGHIDLAKAYYYEAIDVFRPINSNEVKNAQLRIDHLEGKYISPPMPLDLQGMLYNTELACMGNRIANSIIRPWLAFLIENRTHFPDEQKLAIKLKDVLEGNRDISFLIDGIPGKYKFPMKVLLTKLHDQDRGASLQVLLAHITGVLGGNPDAIKSTTDMIYNIQYMPNRPKFFTKGLAESLEHLLSGERDVKKLISLLDDELQIEAFKYILEKENH